MNSTRPSEKELLAVVAQINIEDHPASIGQDTFRSWVNREVDIEDYLVLNALWVSEHPGEYRVLAYESLSPILSGYVESRLQKERESDLSLGIQLGEWVNTTHKTFEENKANLSLAVWALEKLVEKNEPAVKRLRSLIDSSSRIRFPAYELGRALRCMERDSSDRAIAHQR